MSTLLYIMYKLYNPQAANRFIENILNKISILQYLPYIGKIYKNTQERFIVYKNFLIFYEIQEEEKIILIEKVKHMKSNT